MVVRSVRTWGESVGVFFSGLVFLTFRSFPVGCVMEKADKNSVFVLSFDENGRKMYTCESDPTKRLVAEGLEHGIGF